jgi:hypothetical protein
MKYHSPLSRRERVRVSADDMEMYLTSEQTKDKHGN